MTTPHRLEMRDISIAFSGFNALTRVDFTLDGGSIHALTGANGAGKSTLMAVLSGAHDHSGADPDKRRAGCYSRPARC